MGGPGSGKGTQCERLVDRFHATHLSAGDLLRAEVASGSETGLAIAEVIAEGRIVASETTVGLLRTAMARSRGPFLIDGFPRSLANLEAFENELPPSIFMLFLDVSEEVMLQRLLRRGESSGRSDDNEATIRKRFRTYLDESLPVVQELERRGRLRRVLAEDSADNVFNHVCEAFADQNLAVYADQ
jgi:adenylate kinase family enzyme